MAERLSIENLYVDAISVDSVRVDWREYFGGGENFEHYEERADRVWEAVECSDCGQLVVRGLSGDDMHRDLIDRDDRHGCLGDDCEDETCARCVAAKCEGTVPSVEGPMMNFFWGFGGRARMDAEDMARAISHLPLCIVEFEDQLGLALTGGGMDLSWEIAEGYIRCGFCPPAVIRLPRMAGRGKTERDQQILRACIESQKIMANWCKNRESEMAEMLAKE